MRTLTATLSASFFALLIAATPAAANYGAGKKYLQRTDYRGAAISFSAAAARGDARAQLALARLYQAGKGVRRNQARAMALYRRAAAGLIPAANAGRADAQFLLADLYQTGLGVGRDPARALSLLRAAANQGHPSALHKLAIFREWGVGMPRSQMAARRLYRRAADKGSIKARIMDRGQAIEYFEWAARDGSPDDQWAIASWYRKKIFGAFGQRSALRLTRLAAQRGHVKAQARLAELYRTGRAGVARNPVRAYVWGQLAARRLKAGQPVSLAGVRERPNLTPRQRASAEAWLRQWRPSP
jgi:TPR repeat protein